MEEKCPICGRTDAKLPIERGRHYVIYRCSYCGGDIARTALSIDYREEYRRDETPDQTWRKVEARSTPEGKLRETEFLLKHTLEFLKASSVKGKLLDVGCGVGAFAKLAEGLGFEVYAFDLAEEAIRYARENLGLKNTVAGTIDDIPPIWHNFNFVTAFEVLEHVEQPRELVNKIYELLAPGGYFIMSTPNRNRLTVKLRRRESWDYPPHHLTRWSKDSVGLLLDDLGFVNVAIRTGSINRRDLANLLLPSKFNIKISIEKISAPTDPKLGRGVSLVHSPIWKFVQRGGDAIAFLLQKLVGSGHGSGLIAFAQKPPAGV